MKATKWIASPVGTLQLAEENGSITELLFRERDSRAEQAETELLRLAEQELREYFAGQRKVFDLPLSPKGTEFQLRVWNALLTIPYGETRSYADIARLAESPKAFRAVGMANHQNPISILIPCHRVIGKSGALTGYGGGLKAKEFLLDLEEKGSR